MQASHPEIASPKADQSPQKAYTSLIRGFVHLYPWVFWALSAAPLIVLMGLGFFTRYLADDYSTAGALSKYGFWQVQSFWYHTWSGRFSFTFLISLVELAGVAIVPWLPMTAMLILLFSLVWTFRQLFKALAIDIGLIWTGFLANILLFGTIKSLPDFPHVIFWQTGILTYQISIILVVMMIGLFIRRFILSIEKVKRWELYVWWLSFFISGGFSETWVVIQISLVGLAFIGFAFSRLPQKKSLLWMLAGGFVYSWLSLFVISAAPGNMNRNPIMGRLSLSLLGNAFLKAFLDVPHFLIDWFNTNTMLAVMLLLCGLAVGLLASSQVSRQKRNLGLGFLLLVDLYILLWAGFVPQFAVMGIRPQERAIFMPMFLILWGYILFGVFTGMALKTAFNPVLLKGVQVAVMLGLAYMLVWLPLRFSVAYYHIASPLSLYALRWDARDAYLRQARAAGQSRVVAESLRRNPELHDIQSTFWIEGDLQDLPYHWINQAAAQYYGLQSITLHFPGKIDQYQSPG